MKVILASGSPRRRELLERVQLDFTILSVDVDETWHNDESPTDYIERMVATKANAAIQQLNQTTNSNQDGATSCMILTSDTIGVLADGKTVLVKPTDREHAYTMWQQMSDTEHEVWTAVQATLVALDCTSGSTSDNASECDSVFQMIDQQHILERTSVTFIALTQAMMSDYWDSGEPADKAGGYGIQGLGAAWVSRINGSYTNVVGLPLAQTLALIKDITPDSEKSVNSL
ncbi:Maf family protein [Psychrobacter sp. SWN149]|uniref:Maf family protein n=1 Tax=Psychrobacter sp. SWN149 TaxID=2792057 RepID=UPI0018CE87FA|nr:Maf family protein [Psychrobacter sp. SWN149]MBH0007378.1 septum formation protein Maf [Psychrobacter sp. SWN149]